MALPGLRAVSFVVADFFFSSRRRHTRFDCDWSSDVCSSDLAGDNWCSSIPPGFGHPPPDLFPLTLELRQPSVEPVPVTDGLIHLPYAAQVTKIGRASCRERV